MKIINSIVVLLLLVTVAQATAQSDNPIRVWADGASYMYFQDKTLSYVEIYVAIERSDIQFEEVESTYFGKAFLYLEITDQSGGMIDSLGKWLVASVQYLEDAYDENVRIFDCIGVTLEPGEYQMKLTIVDDNSKRSGISTFELKVKDFGSGRLMMSDLELAYSINSVQTDSIYSPLVKAKRRVIPNPNGYYSNEDSLLYVYSEVYNLAEPKGENEEFEVEIRLLDTYGYELREFSKVRHQKPGSTAVLSEAIPLVGLPGGKYLLEVRIKDLATGNKTSASKSLMLIYAFEQLAPTMTSADQFTEEDAKLMEQVIHFISSKEEKKTYRSLTLEGKKSFLESFWKQKDPTPGTRINEYKNETFRRFLYANYNFSTSMISRSDGWKMDMGRVYITYGEPDYIERSPSSMGTKPHQRWEYNRLVGQSGGDYFIFIDETGYGNYRLIHSSLRGEISNPDWEKLVEDGGF